MGKMMDQGPVLVITFVAQQIMAVRNAKGVVVEGDLVSFHCFFMYFYFNLLIYYISQNVLKFHPLFNDNFGYQYSI